jgi:hypothetical protein
MEVREAGLARRRITERTAAECRQETGWWTAVSRPTAGKIEMRLGTWGEHYLPWVSLGFVDLDEMGTR